MDRLSSAEKQKAPTAATLEDWFLEDSEKWIRFIEEQLQSYHKYRGKSIALLLYLLHQERKMDLAYGNNFSTLHQLLDQKYPNKIGPAGSRS